MSGHVVLITVTNATGYVPGGSRSHSSRRFRDCLLRSLLIGDDCTSRIPKCQSRLVTKFWSRNSGAGRSLHRVWILVERTAEIQEIHICYRPSRGRLQDLICHFTAVDLAAASALFNISFSPVRSNSFPARNTSEIFVVL
jgi:hypothetical protein